MVGGVGIGHVQRAGFDPVAAHAPNPAVPAPKNLGDDVRKKVIGQSAALRHDTDPRIVAVRPILLQGRCAAVPPNN